MRIRPRREDQSAFARCHDIGRTDPGADKNATRCPAAAEAFFAMRRKPLGDKAMQHYVEVDEGVRLWAEDSGCRNGSSLLLIMGANASGLVWPDELVEMLGRRHRVIRYDHRDTGRSTWAFNEKPYSIPDLAADAVAILDALDVAHAHVVGMSMGGTLVQLLLLDFPERLLSATVLCTSALGAGLAAGNAGLLVDLPSPDPALLELWEHMDEPRGREAELDWRVQHWRLLNGGVLDFHAEDFRQLEQRVIEHAGRHDNPAAHARANQDGLSRGAELATVAVPTLVVEAPEDPINPPPHAGHIAQVIATAHLVSIRGMGHALGRPVIEPLAAAILTHTTGVDSAAFS
ncbi:alpha/beta hydrolase [Mycolicibacterium sp. S2-37]|uniref:alpha/beta fold hydrolase n=1 Tax=Mycolicibacterium sp. S2-37 TaxID=2810297 RepID=UPI001A93BF62|nr:alpha/beta hydrolase [Mycolicibacterium sp. S2-37]MBO0678815.1 alpha/beta hydrolase [Mycolicibacterium sp. S2-37]